MTYRLLNTNSLNFWKWASTNTCVWAPGPSRSPLSSSFSFSPLWVPSCWRGPRPPTPSSRPGTAAVRVKSDWALSLGQPSPRVCCSTVTRWHVSTWSWDWSVGSWGPGWTHMRGAESCSESHQAMSGPGGGQMVSGTGWPWWGQESTPAWVWTPGVRVSCVMSCHTASTNTSRHHHQASQSGQVASAKYSLIKQSWSCYSYIYLDFQSMLCWFDFSKDELLKWKLCLAMDKHSGCSRARISQPVCLCRGASILVQHKTQGKEHITLIKVLPQQNEWMFAVIWRLTLWLTTPLEWMKECFYMCTSRYISIWMVIFDSSINTHNTGER